MRTRKPQSNSFGAQHRRATRTPSACIVASIARDDNRRFIVRAENDDETAQRIERSKARASARAFALVARLAGR